MGSDLDNVRVPAGNNQTDARQRDLRMRQEVCVNMPFNMVHADERFFQRISQPLGCAQANQERADQPRPHGHSDGIELCKAVAAFCQRFFYDNINVFQMLARRHLRHHAAKFSWILICVETTFAQISWPSRITAQAVSSQLDSMARITLFNSFIFPLPFHHERVGAIMIICRSFAERLKPTGFV